MSPSPRKKGTGGGGSSQCMLLGLASFLCIFVFILYECSNFVDLHEHRSSQVLSAAKRMHESHITEDFKWNKRPSKNGARSTRADRNAEEEREEGAREDLDFDVNWDLQFWTPIEVAHGGAEDDPLVKMCRLNFEKYAGAPHTYPMFRDLITMSNCNSRKATRSAKLSTLVAKVQEHQGHGVLKPTGFIFHESRVGSTLVANAFGADPQNLVFSESAPPTGPMLHCRGCTREQQVQRFRDVVTVMGMSRIHKRLFFKFQSSTVMGMDVALEAFPDTPWAFVYRDPVQTMMSHVAPNKISMGTPVCARSKSAPPRAVRERIDAAGGSLHGADGVVQYCAAHLANLCHTAYTNFQKYGTFADGSPRGLLLDYAVMPGGIASILVPHFNLDVTTINPKWLENMERETSYYSKDKKHTSAKFKGDSEKKEEGATPEIERWAVEFMQPIYEKMKAETEKSFKRLLPAELSLEVYSKDTDDMDEKFAVLRHFRPWTAKVEGHHSGEGSSSSRSSSSSSSSSSSIHSVQHRSIPSFSSSRSSAMHSHSVIKDMPLITDESNPFVNTHSSVPHEKVSCPIKPEKGYPKHYPAPEVIANWSPDDVTIPEKHYDGLCHFDWSNPAERKAAENYRAAEVPFVVYNHEDLDSTASKWSKPEYVEDMLGGKSYMTETSTSNHFMYWHKPSKSYIREHNWEAPTGNEKEKFSQWLEIAMKGHTSPLEETTFRYFRASAGDSASWIDHDLPWFRKNDKPSVFMVKPKESHGVHCRFGMRGIIAEAHWDGSRNMVAMIGGLRRWILSHPSNCVHQYMYPKAHPSGRHSSVDWSNWDKEKFPDFEHNMINEVILQAGDFLYVPTDWIHYIVSLGINYQCNCRSGITLDYRNLVNQCRG